MSKHQPYSEEQLIAMLQTRDEQAFGVVYNAYGAALYGIVVKIVRSDDVAEDVLQDSFIKIWKRIEHFDRSKGSLFTWLLNITRNNAIDYIRSKYARNQVPNDETLVSMESEEFYELPIDTMGVAEQLEKLQPEHKLLIDMLYFQGYTQKEVSEELHIPLGTIKTRTRSAFNHLRTLLKELKNE